MKTLQQTFQVLNLDALAKAPLQTKPFPYLVIDNIFYPEVMGEIETSFPKLSGRGSFPLHAVTPSGKFQTLLEELESPELRSLVGEKFGIDLEDKPPMITVRGYTGEKDGRIHVDSSSKLITFLLYLNPNWQSPKGRLRLLYNSKDLAPFAEEVAPEAGRVLIFKVTKNCWHGHEPFVGERRSIQLNYVASEKQKDRHILLHRFSAFFKALMKKKDAPNTNY